MRIARHLLVISLLGVSVAVMQAQAGPRGDEFKLLNLLNQERQRTGLAKLQWDQHLAESALAHAEVMARHGQLSHQFSGEPELGERISATGVRFDASAENVAFAPTVEEGHRALMNSPPHRANILNAQYNAVGLAVVLRNGQLYIGQNFAHTITAYSDSQFRIALVAAFNQARRAKGLADISPHVDTSLTRAACSGETNPNKLIAGIPSAVDLEIFTSSVPEKLPVHMQEAAANAAFQRMSIGVCFNPGKEHGYSSFEVVAAFFARP